MKYLTKILTAVLLVALSCAATAQTCGAPGVDGPLSGAIVNTYYPPANIGTLTAGATSVTIGTKRPAAAPSLAIGDLILIIQMQGAIINSSNSTAYGANNASGRGYSGFPANGQAGFYEYRRVTAVAGATLTFDRPLTSSYVQANASATTGAQTFQIVRIPQYSSAVLTNTTLNAANDNNWNGTTGGIVAADIAGTLNLNGATISAASAGFRGGAQRTDGHGPVGTEFVSASDQSNTVNRGHGQKGEGIAGRPTEVWDGAIKSFATASNNNSLVGYPRAGATVADGNEGNGAPATAGGGGIGGASGGGGGGNGGEGGIGGQQWNNSITLPAVNVTGGLAGVRFAQTSAGRMVLGGGGGAGSSNDPVTGGAGSGGVGGGMVIVRAGSFSGAGIINVNGAAGPDNLLNDGAGGGGAAGSVYVSAGSGSLANLTVLAIGGNGGNNNPSTFAATVAPHGPGGGGGGGTVFSSSALNAASSVLGGTNGVNLAAAGTTNNAWGALSGTNGTVNQTAAAPAESSAGATCLPQLSVTKRTLTPLLTLPSQNTAVYVINISNSSAAGAAYGVAVSDILPAPFALQSVTALATSSLAGINTSGPAPTTPNTSGNISDAVFGVAGSANSASPSFTVFPGGSVTLSFIVQVNTATIATYQNSANTTFTDPTRTTGSAANGTAVINPVASPGGNYASGAAVAGSNYPSGSSTYEDVQLVAATNLAVTKTKGTDTLVAGRSTIYTLTFTNNGFAANGAIVKDSPSTGLSCTTVTCQATTGGATCPVGLTSGTATPVASVPNFFNGTGIPINSFPSPGTVTLTVACDVTATGAP